MSERTSEEIALQLRKKANLIIRDELDRCFGAKLQV
jgi:hypothetical protein